MSSQNSEFIKPQTKRRLINDISNLYKNPLNDQGIFYIHDDKDILKGYSMIIGPKDTPYENGFYFFEFSFPYDYPVNPPVVKFLNLDGKTRFNPNLYRNGKVCLSILNTWQGEGWTSCQTIRSVLLTLVTVLNEKPLLNEPGIDETHKEFLLYNQIIQYQNINYSIVEILSGNTNNYIIPFIKFAQEHIIKNKNYIMEKIQHLSLKYPNKYDLCISIYQMKCSINYPDLLKKFTCLLEDIEKDLEH